jgi:hypothetical protein
MVLDLHVIIDDFKSGLSKVFQRLWIRLLKVYDDLKGISWIWQSLDSVSIKAPLGGLDRSKGAVNLRNHLLL